MVESLYERDALAWAEQQADLLRRLAAGERLNAAVDWPNVIEEVQDVGQSQLRACRSLLQQGMRHLLKCQAWPESSAVAHWREEAGVFLVDAEDCFTPSMQQRIVLGELYAKALRLVRSMRDLSSNPRPLPDHCPFTLDELLAGDTDQLLGTLARTAPSRDAEQESSP